MNDSYTTFRRLCDYLIECLRYSEKEQEFLFDDQLNNTFLLPVLPSFWFKFDNQIDVEINKNQKPARNYIARSTDLDEIFIGYPLSSFFSKSSSQHVLSPIILFPVELIINEFNFKVSIDRRGICINRKWVDLKIPKDRQTSFYKSCEQYIDNESKILDVEAIIQYLNNYYKLNLDPNSLDYSIDHKDSSRNIINSAALFIASKPKYNKNLINEIKYISKQSSEILDKTAIAHVFRDEPLIDEPVNSNLFPLTFTDNPLNYNQIKALKKALNNPLSKITGPPGTGKSHVSINLIANELFYGGQVLFASRNHKAIHAIFEGCKSLFSTDFNLVEFCTSPSNDDNKWQNYKQNNIDTKLGFAKLFERNLLELKKSELDLDDCSSLLVDEAVNNLSDIDSYIERYEKIRSNLQLFANLSSQIDNYLSNENLQVQNIEQLESILKTIDALILTNESRSLFGKLITYIRNIIRPGLDCSSHFSELDDLLPNTIKKFNTNDSIKKRVTNLIKILRQKRKLDDIYCSTEVERNLLDNSDLNYDCLKEQFKKNYEIINENLKEVFVNKMFNRALSVDDSDNLINIIKAIYSDILKLIDFPLRRQNDIVEKLLSYKDVFNKFYEIYPAWACTLLSLKNASPCLPGVFSLAIIDEASQCDYPPIIPALYRAKRFCVIGDPNQFSPIFNISSKTHEYLKDKYGISGERFGKYSFDLQTAYDIIPIDAIELTEHFRCTDQIASYFNKEFYFNRLCPCVGNRMDDNDNWTTFGIKPGMEWVDIIGGDGAEIDEVIRYLIELKKLNFKGSIGIITPLRRVVESLLPKCYEHIDELPEKLNSKDLIKEYVSTVYSFQGGQCDIIIFLLGLNSDRAHGEEWYITSEDNKFIFNVAVSRARVLFKTIGDKKMAFNTGLSRIINLYPKDNIIRSFKIGPGEKILQDALKKDGIKTESQYPVVHRWLDLAIPDYKIDIEVDGQAWHLDANGCRKADDIYRDMLLESKGWEVIRIWHNDVVRDVDSCVLKIKDCIKKRKECLGN